jgi:hypothetical protein
MSSILGYLTLLRVTKTEVIGPFIRSILTRSILVILALFYIYFISLLTILTKD